MKILNLGCGFDKRGFGIDINPECKPDLIADVCKPLPIKKKFDYVIAIDVLEHVLQPRILIENMLKHVKANGSCYIVSPSALAYEINFRFHRGQDKINEPTMQYLTPCVVKGIINRIGGKVIWQSIGCKYWVRPIRIRFKGE